MNQPQGFQTNLIRPEGLNTELGERREQLADMSGLASVLLDHCSTEDPEAGTRSVAFSHRRTGRVVLVQRRASPGQDEEWRSSMWLHVTPPKSDQTSTFNLSPWADQERILPQQSLVEAEPAVVELCAAGLRRMGIQFLHRGVAEILAPIEPMRRLSSHLPERRMLLMYGPTQFLLSGPGGELAEASLSIGIGPSTLLWVELAGFNLDLRRNTPPPMSRVDQQLTWLLRAVHEGQTPAERAATRNKVSGVDQLTVQWQDLINTPGVGECRDILPGGADMVRVKTTVTNELFGLDDTECVVGVVLDGPRFQVEIVDLAFINPTRIAVWADTQNGSAEGRWRKGDMPFQPLGGSGALAAAVSTIDTLIAAIVSGDASSIGYWQGRFAHDKLSRRD